MFMFFWERDGKSCFSTLLEFRYFLFKISIWNCCFLLILKRSFENFHKFLLQIFWISKHFFQFNFNNNFIIKYNCSTFVFNVQSAKVMNKSFKNLHFVYFKFILSTCYYFIIKVLDVKILPSQDLVTIEWVEPYESKLNFSFSIQFLGIH